MTFDSSGIDTGESHQLQVIPFARGCLVKDRVTFFSAAGGIHGPLFIPPVYDCKSIQSFADGLMVKGCVGESAFGERDFVIPLYPAVIRHLCGWVDGVNIVTQSDPPDALHCFWRAYTRCQAATLILSSPKITASPNNPPLQAFISFQPSNGVCAVSLVERHIQGDFIPRTCADLINRGIQLVVTACGTLGDVVIPLASGAPLL